MYHDRYLSNFITSIHAPGSLDIYYRISSLFRHTLQLTGSLVLVGLVLISCKSDIQDSFNTNNFEKAVFVPTTTEDIIPAAERVATYVPLLKGKKVGLVVNQSSRVGGSHLLDTLLSLEVDVHKVFTPEHGFSGTADAGEKVEDTSRDAIPIISLYGKNKKPSPDQMKGLDVVVFDIQDVGVRFYTYISTLHYVMEACAEQNVELIILDRPNPNGFYIDGPIREEKYSSFVGMHPVPVVYGMSIAEYGQMINGEGWLENGLRCSLTVIECLNYDHTMTYDLPIKPSPNLPNLRSILLYPSLCFFEGTQLSIGRGTDKQFQVIGHPDLKDKTYTFTPVSKPGAKNPKHKGKECGGEDLSDLTTSAMLKEARLNISWLIDYAASTKNTKTGFFLPDNNFFEKLAGTDQLRKQILSGASEEAIRDSWVEGLESFKKVRAKYLLY